jgi:hypothetical protein
MRFWIGHWIYSTFISLTVIDYNLQWCFRQFTITVFSLTLFLALQFTTHTLSPVGQLSDTSPLVPASPGNTGC